MKAVLSAVMALALSLVGAAVQAESSERDAERHLARATELASILQIDRFVDDYARYESANTVKKLVAFGAELDPDAERLIRDAVESFVLAWKPEFRRFVSESMSAALSEAELIELIDYNRSDFGMRTGPRIAKILNASERHALLLLRAMPDPKEAPDVPGPAAELLTALEYERRIMGAGEYWAEETISTVKLRNPGLDAQGANEIRRDFLDRLGRILPWLKAGAGERLAAEFTPEERQALVAYFRSDASMRYHAWHWTFVPEAVGWIARLTDTPEYAELADKVTAVAISHLREAASE